MYNRPSANRSLTGFYDAQYGRLAPQAAATPAPLHKSGPFIGPSGGLWSDAEHKNHWSGDLYQAPSKEEHAHLASEHLRIAGEHRAAAEAHDDPHASAVLSDAAKKHDAAAEEHHDLTQRGKHTDHWPAAKASHGAMEASAKATATAERLAKPKLQKSAEPTCRLGTLPFNAGNGRGDALGLMSTFISHTRPTPERPVLVRPTSAGVPFSAERPAATRLHKSFNEFYGYLGAGASGVAPLPPVGSGR